MSFDFSKIVELSTARGKLVELKNSAGRVIWTAQSAELVAGTLILRPSADISVEHSLYPHDSTTAYLLINEEVADGTATYITSYDGKVSPKSRFCLFGEPQHKIVKITSITIKGVPYNASSKAGYNTFRLCFDGEEFESSRHNSTKDIDLSLANAVTPINEYIAKNGNLPAIDLVISSEAPSNTGGTKFYHTGVTQVYVVLAYEGY